HTLRRVPGPLGPNQRKNRLTLIALPIGRAPGERSKAGSPDPSPRPVGEAKELSRGSSKSPSPRSGEGTRGAVSVKFSRPLPTKWGGHQGSGLCEVLETPPHEVGEGKGGALELSYTLLAGRTRATTPITSPTTTIADPIQNHLTSPVM